MHGDMTAFYWLLAMADPMVWFFLLNVLDAVLTLYVLKHGGIELNRVLAKWFTRDDPDVVLIRMKALLLSIVWLAAYFGALPEWAMWALIVGYAGLAAWNLRSVYRTWKRVNP